LAAAVLFGLWMTTSLLPAQSKASLPEFGVCKPVSPCEADFQTTEVIEKKSRRRLDYGLWTRNGWPCTCGWPISRKQKFGLNRGMLATAPLPALRSPSPGFAVQHVAPQQKLAPLVREISGSKSQKTFYELDWNIEESNTAGRRPRGFPIPEEDPVGPREGSGR